MNFANLGAAVAALAAHAKSIAPDAAEETERLAVNVFHNMDIAEKASAPVLAEAVTIAAPVGEMALQAYLIGQLGPVLGPAASATADVFISGGARAISERLNPPPPVIAPPAADATAQAGG